MQGTISVTEKWDKQKLLKATLVHAITLNIKLRRSLTGGRRLRERRPDNHITNFQAFKVVSVHISFNLDMFNSCGKLISRKYPVLPIKKSLLSYPWMPDCYSTLHKLQFIIQFPLHCLSSGRLAKENFKPPAPNCSCSLTRRGRLQEVPIEWFDFKTFGILENLSMKIGGRNRRLYCILFGSFCLPFYYQGLILQKS